MGDDWVGKVECPSYFGCCWCVCFIHVSEVGARIIQVARLNWRIGIHEIDVFFGCAMVVIDLEASQGIVEFVVTFVEAVWDPVGECPNVVVVEVRVVDVGRRDAPGSVDDYVVFHVFCCYEGGVNRKVFGHG